MLSVNKLDRYVVMGNPVEHSKSPRIHTLFAAQTQQSLIYERHRVPLDAFQASVRAFQEAGGRGCNVTVPFKQEAWHMATDRSDYAERAGAVNTLVFLEQGKIFGANTDGIGLVRDLLQRLQWQLQDKRILLLGAGGAARGVLQPLLMQQPRELVIANRTISTAQQLAGDFTLLGEVQGIGLDDLTGEFDVIINATSASLQGHRLSLPSTCITLQTACYDMMYGAKPTLFMEWATQHDAIHVSDGLGMLVEQAAEAFYLWRGVRPDTTPVLKQLRAELSV